MAVGGAEVVVAQRMQQQSTFIVESRNPAAPDRDLVERSRTMADPSSYQMTGNSDNIDERDRDDPLCATAYVQEMYEHFREKEISTSVRPVYMANQEHINERMRAILVDWLVEVHLKFKLVPETLYLTVNLIDRYLERTSVSRPKLQLVGVTSLLIASKYEEIYPPELRDLVYICDRAYTRQDVSNIKGSRCRLNTLSNHQCFLRL
jgi:G2/mitotic-specific cyclin-B, other